MSGIEVVAQQALAAEDRALIDAAEEASLAAYAPYSRFLVGAAIRATDGTVVSGCNVENVSYGVTFCAEIGAFMAAVRGGSLPVADIAVYGRLTTAAPDDPRHGRPVTPCGRCRQALAEMANAHRRDIRVIGSSADRATALVGPLSAFLPAAFDIDLASGARPSVSSTEPRRRSDKSRQLARLKVPD